MSLQTTTNLSVDALDSDMNSVQSESALPIILYDRKPVVSPCTSTHALKDCGPALDDEPSLTRESYPLFEPSLLPLSHVSTASLDEKQRNEFPFPIMTSKDPWAGSEACAAATSRKERKPPPPSLNLLAARTLAGRALPTPPLTLSPSASSDFSCTPSPVDSIFLADPFPEPPNVPRPPESCSAGACFDCPDKEDEAEEPPSLSDFDPSYEGETFSSKFLCTYKTLPHFMTHYTVDFELGTGGFGFVVRGRRRSDQLAVAVKFIFKHLMAAQSLILSPRWKEGTRPLPMEADVLMRLDHPGIVKFVDLLEDDKLFYLIMEHHGTQWTDRAQRKAPGAKTGLKGMPVKQKTGCEPQNAATATTLHVPRPSHIRRSSSDLFERIDTCERFTEQEARYIFVQVVSIVSYLDSEHIYHMDIKDENIVVDDQLKVKLIDFGSAVCQDELKPLRRFFGTYLYAPPEVLQRKMFFAPETEVWSLGILYCLLLLGCSIYKGPKEVLSNSYNRRAFASVPFECQRVIRCCLERKPADRASVRSLRAHPYLAAEIQKYERAHNISFKSP